MIEYVLDESYRRNDIGASFLSNYGMFPPEEELETLITEKFS